MKSIILKSFFALVISLNVFSALAGSDNSQPRTVEPFTSIKLKNSANVYVTRSEKPTLKIEADQSVLAKITTVVNGGELVIDGGNDVITQKAINIYITVSNLNSVSIAGSGNIESKTVFPGKTFNATVAGSGNITMMLQVEGLDATVAGSGNIVLSGKSSTANVKIPGSGTVDIRGIPVSEATVSIAGSGNCKVDAHDSLNASVVGSGNIYYVGEPKKITSKVTGSGEIKKLSSAVGNTMGNH